MLISLKRIVMSNGANNDLHLVVLVWELVCLLW